MTVCRYFRNGYCRNGDACRFEHSYYNQRSPLLNTPTHNAGYSTGYGQRGHGGSPGGDWRDAEQQQQQSLVDQIITHIDLMLQGKHYLFSCVPGLPPHLNVKGLSDLSPEEIRVKFLECQATNNIERFLSEMSSHRIYVEGILHQLSRNPSRLNDTQPPFGSSVILPTSQTEASFAMSSSYGPPSGAILGASPPSLPTNFSAQPPSPFGTIPPMTQMQQPPAPMTATGVIQDQAQPQMLFGKAVQSSGSLFDRNRLSPPTFQQAPQITPTGFASMAPAAPIAQTMPVQQGFPMGAPPAQNTPRPPFEASQGGDDVYSCLMDMSPEDLAAYQERAFTIAAVPLVPPAKEHCF